MGPFKIPLSFALPYSPFPEKDLQKLQPWNVMKKYRKGARDHWPLAMDTWCLLEKEEFVFFKIMVPGTDYVPVHAPHPHEYIDSTNKNQWVETHTHTHKRGGHMKLWLGSLLGEEWRVKCLYGVPSSWCISEPYMSVCRTCLSAVSWVCVQPTLLLLFWYRWSRSQDWPASLFWHRVLGSKNGKCKVELKIKAVIPEFIKNSNKTKQNKKEKKIPLKPWISRKQPK